MKHPRRPSRISRQNRLFNLFKTEFSDVRRAYEMFDEFLRQKTYNDDFCLKLLAIAKRKDEASWDLRRLAVLMLEHQALKIPPNQLDDFELLFTRLDLMSAPGINKAIVRSVLKEGYSATDLRDFIPEFRRKLERMNYVHGKIKGRRTSDIALRNFIEISRLECKLSLTRYLFTAEEVADRILKHLQITDGMKDVDRTQPAFVGDQLSDALSRLPDFEARIVERLSESSDIYWVSENTSAEINSLVEYPLTTVVVVVKLPGSNIELELKRVGRKGKNSLNVVYARNGYTVSPSHRLDGGCMRWLLRFEANAASRFAFIYRGVHGTVAPMASYISRSTIFSIPVGKTRVQTFPYFTEPQLFGDGFQAMRVAMRESVDAFREEGSSQVPQLRGELGLTAQFISQVAPAQAILSGTTSFRLDKVAAYLSNDGPRLYFEEGLGVKYSRHDARRFADSILQEILGVYQPPTTRYQSHNQYIKAAYGVAENRGRADQIYLSLMKQIAKFWGTLLAVRGYSRGESFVGRNAGLKSVWEAGQWQVRIIFMDHDALVIPGPQDKNFLAQNALPEMALDERYIWGGTNAAQFATSEVGYLRNIYRVAEDVGKKGEVLANQNLRSAYKKTRSALSSKLKLRALFNEQFVRRLPDWDTFVSGYLQLNGNESATTSWKKQIKKTLAANGYRDDSFENFEKAINKNREFLERYRRLFEPETKEKI
jgi:hypothetical protein